MVEESLKESRGMREKLLAAAAFDDLFDIVTSANLPKEG